MKSSRKISLVLMLIAGALLSACAGGTAYNNWPGLSAGQGVVYLAYHTGVFAIRASDGSQAWRFPDPAETSKAFYAPPGVGGEVLTAGDFSGNIYGVNAANGKQNWIFTREGGHAVGGALVVGDVTLAPSSNHHLYAINKDGSLKWDFVTRNLLWAAPVSDGKTIYLAAMDHNLYALNLADGTLLWKRDLGAALTSSAVLGEDGTLYAATLDGKVYAVNTVDGKIVWDVLLDGNVWSSPLLHQGILYVSNSNGKAYALSTTNEAKRTVFAVDLGGALIGGPALYNEAVVFPVEDGTVQAISLTGEKTWKATVNGKLYTTPVVVDNVLVVAAKDGKQLLVGFNASGVQQWELTEVK